MTNTTYFPLDRLNEEQTPFYYYDLHLLDETLEAVKKASSYPNFYVHYAVKANSNPEILTRIAASGLGADTVSLGEIRAAITAGFPAPKIVFAGVGKTDEEIITALQDGIGCFNVESAAELEVIEEIAASMGVKAPVALRVNPEIDAHTHHYITTGLAENKFGIALTAVKDLVDKCVKSESLDFRGFHFHIGSQITDFTPFKILCERINSLQEQFADIDIPTINVGGGLGIDYDAPDENPIPDFESYFSIFHENLKLRPGQQVHFELGRAIVAQCGSLITKVVFVKEGVGKKFVIVDGGMTALIRPALYQAHHKIENISSTSEIEEKYDVVGPICESSDVFGEDEVLPLTKRGDLIALRSAGAYGEIMASSYNCRPLPGSVFSR
ncbi:MAG: diaminopimelate decarboxylase [Muribaculaceae bacterium]|nr:diaminopimelate decarboxylase [Muribaculaceae bacterium]MDE6754250.1 diaminopimelate decarboxylase [Muribaculaceae bacterium]